MGKCIIWKDNGCIEDSVDSVNLIWRKWNTHVESKVLDDRYMSVNVNMVQTGTAIKLNIDK